MDTFVGLIADQGLFITLAIFNITGFFRKWVVPGPTHREIVGLHKLRGDEALAASAQKDITIEKLASSNKIIDYFFNEVAVKDDAGATIPTPGQVVKP